MVQNCWLAQRSVLFHVAFFIALQFLFNFNHPVYWWRIYNYPAGPRSISHMNTLQLVCSSDHSVSLQSPVKLHKCQADIVNPPHCSHENPPQANRASKNNCSHLKAMREWYLIIWVHFPRRLIFPSDPPHSSFCQWQGLCGVCRWILSVYTMRLGSCPFVSHLGL